MNTKLISKTFTINGIFSFVVGLVLAFDAEYVVNYFHWPQTAILYVQIIGTACAIFGLDLVLVARSKKWLNRYLVTTVFYLDIVWVIATPMLLVILPTSIFGTITLLVVAGFVGTFAYYEFRGLNQNPQTAS